MVLYVPSARFYVIGVYTTSSRAYCSNMTLKHKTEKVHMKFASERLGWSLYARGLFMARFDTAEDAAASMLMTVDEFEEVA